jgi:uncharacterized YceG family protein
VDGRQRQRVRRRRAAALAVAALAVAGLVVALAACGGDDATTPTTTAGPAPPQTLAIIFPEGFTVRDMGERVAAVREIAIRKRNVTPRLTQAGYLAAAQQLVPPLPFRKDWRGERSPEGFLFPALYEFTQATPARDLVADQLDAFRRRWSKVDMRYARSKNLTPYDVLIIASMIEKETVVPAERRLVAAVIYNRLRARMPLGIDATIRYGLDIPGTESLTKKALASDNPYNTRLRPGLPPTPIANPGLPSMQAAAHPAQVDYLYFVRKPDKRHHYFTADENDFLRKVCEYGFGCS